MKKVIISIVCIFSIFQLNVNAQSLNCNCGEVSLRKVTAKSGLILRKLPSINSEKITGIPFNEKVLVGIDYEFQKEETIENKLGYWVRAKYNGVEGFLFSGYLSEEPIYDVVNDAAWEFPLGKKNNYMGLFTEIDDPYSNSEMQMKKMGIDTVSYVGENAVEKLGVINIENENYPYYVFSGLNNYERKIDVRFFEMEEGSIYPGVMRSIFYSGSTYTLYATGNVVKSKSEDAEQTMVIKNYQVILERRSPDAVQHQVILQKDEMPISYWGSGGLANVRIVGDLDGDAQPDLIIENYDLEGYETNLFLSSEAEKGFLVKLVRRVFGACC